MLFELHNNLRVRFKSMNEEYNQCPIKLQFPNSCINASNKN